MSTMLRRPRCTVVKTVQFSSIKKQVNEDQMETRMTQEIMNARWRVHGEKEGLTSSVK